MATLLDLWCAEVRLAIEVDGAGHMEPARQEQDSERTAALASLGVRVVRFTNTEVLTSIDAVVQRIADVLEEMGAAINPRG